MDSQELHYIQWRRHCLGSSMYVPPEKVFVQLFFTQFKASENAVILMMVVVQVGQLIFYDTLRIAQQQTSMKR